MLVVKRVFYFASFNLSVFFSFFQAAISTQREELERLLHKTLQATAGKKSELTKLSGKIVNRTGFFLLVSTIAA